MFVLYWHLSRSLALHQVHYSTPERITIGENPRGLSGESNVCPVIKLSAKRAWLFNVKRFGGYISAGESNIMHKSAVQIIVFMYIFMQKLFNYAEGFAHSKRPSIETKKY